MRETLEVHEPLLVNALGHSAGAVIFGIFLFQLLRDRAGAHLRDSSKAVAASALTLAWSLTSLAVIFWNDPALFGVQVLIALTMNAMDATPEQGRVTVRTRKVQNEAGANFAQDDAEWIAWFEAVLAREFVNERKRVANRQRVEVGERQRGFTIYDKRFTRFSWFGRWLTTRACTWSIFFLKRLRRARAGRQLEIANRK